MAAEKGGSAYRPGATIDGRFAVLEFLGRGGTGEVYRVTDRQSGKPYALKSFHDTVLPAHVPPSQLQSFLGPLVPRADGISRPYHFGEDRGRKYIVSDLLEGASLRALLRARRARGDTFSCHEAAAIVRAVSRVFLPLPPYTVHGNLKPENIFLPGVAPEGIEPIPTDGLTAALSDFGLVRVVPFSKFASLQLSAGTYAYLSPEHLSFGGRVDQKADIYALGVLFYELVTGAPPGPNPQPLSALDPRLPEAADAFARRAMRPEAALRHRDHHDLLADLERILRAPDHRLAAPGPAGSEADAGGFHPDEVLTAEVETTLEALAYPDAAQELKARGADRLEMPTPDEPTIRRPAASPEPEPLPTTAAPPEAANPAPAAAAARPIDIPTPPEPILPPARPEQPTEPTLPVPPAPSAQGAKFDPKAEILSDTQDDLASWLARVDAPGPRRRAGKGTRAGNAAPPTAEPPRAASPVAPLWEPPSVVFTPRPATADDFFAGMGRPGPAPAQSPTSAPPAQAPVPPPPPATAPPEPPFDPIGAPLPPPGGEEPPAVDENDEELAALRKMIAEAELEPERPAPPRRASRPPAEPPRPSPPPEAGAETSAAEEAADEFPPLESDPFAPPTAEDEFSRRFARTLPSAPRPNAAPGEARHARGSYRRRQRSSPLPKIVLGVVVLLILGVIGMVIYRVRFQGPSPEAGEPSEKKTAGDLSFLDGGAPAKSDEEGEATPQGASQGIDEGLRQILGLPAADSDKPVSELALQAEEWLKTNKIFDPPAPNNAFWALSQILKKEPGNAFARKKMAEIGTKYYRLAQNEVGRKNFARAKEYIDKALLAQPDDASYKSLQEELVAAIQGGVTTSELKCPAGMVLIGAGPFPFGAAKEDDLRMFGDKDLADTYQPAFCIDVYEYPNKAGTLPTVKKTVHEAQVACEQQGKRLCTEEEWEKACKGKEGTRFPYGNDFDPAACNTEDADAKDRDLAPAGSWPRCKSGYGVFDMSGNVKEWTSSTWKSGLEDYSVRGGAFRSPGKAARCAVREANPPQTQSTIIGFRCCKSM